jgi:DNA-binding response OmpR family regulator
MINSEKRNSAPRIMVVDDEADITLQLSVVLEENGFKVDPFNDALLALENFKPDLYDLLILDIKMPKMNGFISGNKKNRYQGQDHVFDSID